MINISLEIKELEVALQHLYRGAYADVVGLIQKIHGQAQSQVQAVQQEVVTEVKTVSAEVEKAVEPTTQA
jgi:hypothetical protein